jgi:hypothetical protein
MTTLKIHRLRLYFDAGTGDPTDPPTELDVAILPGDRMRAERLSTHELPHAQRSGPGARREHAETWLLLYAWCAATRCGYAGTFEQYGRELLHYAELDAAGELLEDGDELDPDDAETVPPTVPGLPTS